MPNFIDRLSEKLADETTRAQLRQTLSQDARPDEKSLQELVRQHWHTLPAPRAHARRPAYAVDGSRAVRHLANGAYLFVAQALAVGERNGARVEATDVDVQILPGATPTPFVERFAELMMHRLEATLAREHARALPEGGVVFLDGALYGQLPQLYRVANEPSDNAAAQFAKDALNQNVDQILSAYRDLFRASETRQLWLISIAKTSREATHMRVWWQHRYGDTLPKEQEIADSEALYRWTARAAGFSTPILFGKRAFAKQPEAIVFDKVKDAPAIASFFVRLSDFDDALRVDVPAICLGRTEKIGDVEMDAEILLDQPADWARVAKLLDILRADYGGLEVYNALLYSVDREVRLRQEMMDEVYFSIIQNSLGADIELRLDRSERRFHSIYRR